jgi:hypothetical protein
MGFKGSKKNTPYAAQKAAEDCAKVAFDLGVCVSITVYVKGPGSGRDAAITNHSIIQELKWELFMTCYTNYLIMVAGLLKEEEFNFSEIRN